MNQPQSPHGISVHHLAGPPIVKEARPPPCVLVIFGATGDLTSRKLIPAVYNLMADGALPSHFAVVGISREPCSPEVFRARMREATTQFSRQPVDGAKWDRFAGMLHFVSGTFEDLGVFAALKKKLAEIDKEQGTQGHRIFYLATPSSAFPVILRGLHQGGLLYRPSSAGGESWSRVIIEKPFGRDLPSARALNEIVGQFLDESQTFRIDHYLGKETVQNILLFRFGNSIFEPLWNRKYIDHVEITAAESLGVERRGAFYDATGVLRDIVQNHLLQVLALCAIESPVSLGADDVRDEKMKLLRSLHPIAGSEAARNVVLGQYRGYLKEPGVAPSSRTATYAALKVLIDNWRWQGVPFYLRAGKRLAERRTEVTIHFQSVPLSLFPAPDGSHNLDPNVLCLQIQPNEGISLKFMAKVPGEHIAAANVLMSMTYAQAFGKPLSDAYERLLLECMRGDATLFMRRDEVEQAWSFVTPILEAWDQDVRSPVPTYEPGSAGPKEADELIARDGRAWTQLGQPGAK